MIRNRYITTAESISYDTARELEQVFTEQSPELTDTGVSHSIRLSTLQVNSTKAENFVLQAAMLYGGVVLMVICLTVLSLQQLMDAGQYRYRFSVLRKLDVEEQHIGRLVLSQCCCSERLSEQCPPAGIFPHERLPAKSIVFYRYHQ